MVLSMGNRQVGGRRREGSGEGGHGGGGGREEGGTRGQKAGAGGSRWEQRGVREGAQRDRRGVQGGIQRRPRRGRVRGVGHGGAEGAPGQLGGLRKGRGGTRGFRAGAPPRSAQLVPPGSSRHSLPGGAAARAERNGTGQVGTYGAGRPRSDFRAPPPPTSWRCRVRFRVHPAATSGRGRRARALRRCPGASRPALWPRGCCCGR